jgi:biotin transport system substrate-specific component
MTMIKTVFVAPDHLTARQNALRTAALALLGSLLLAVSAKVQVPFWPVPMTMQTFVVLMIGAHSGVRLAAATVVTYLIEGALGLPVFSTGAGLVFMAGPTGGYLLGFLGAAVITALFVERGYTRSVVGAALVFMAADGIILGAGFAWLSNLIGFEKAFAFGVLPFLPAEALKIAIATASVPLARSLTGRKSKAN